MEKKVNTYHLTLTPVRLASGEPVSNKQLDLTVDNHDELFSIIERLQEKDPFGDKAQAAEFALGLKLFSEVMLKHRNNPLFEELKPAFQPFMKRLKSL
ncbi:DUF3861 domain-containing protein [Spirosoma sp. KUDC1026]|uniref:DUF3861 domain-containing protein n=1 Tax=Spirosoma sp. KUDC1026 TaxID=2745947 RepID=UPI00159B93C4|nr:DUF3861 domain-containing protein [Spirosoma sp. KUDC1026]QKZ13840.1 DUF3861 domain-containing protein [Spirosoma sp. KUDC1026]